MEENQGCIRSCLGCGCSTIGTAVSLVITVGMILVAMALEVGMQPSESITITKPGKTKSAKSRGGKAGKSGKSGKTKSRGKKKN